MAETSAAPASLEGCLPELVNALACTKWLGRYVEGAFGMDAFEAGLFRVRASDATVDRLRRIMKYPEGLPYQKISLFLEENRAEKGLCECANAISSVLKGYLRDLPKPLLPFAFCTEDLRKFALGEASQEGDEDARSEIGSNLAEDLMHTMVTFHRDCSNEVLSTAISLAGQIFALLCTVSRMRIFEMQSYDLFVPFLPSICGARDPMQLIQEHKSIKMLNDERRAAEIDHRQPPQTRLEVMIIFGHRVWGYIKACMPDLDVAIDALREYDAEHKANGGSFSDSHNRHRKRDILKRIMKPNRWFHDKSHHGHHNQSKEQQEKQPVAPPPFTAAAAAQGKAQQAAVQQDQKQKEIKRKGSSAAMASLALRMQKSPSTSSQKSLLPSGPSAGLHTTAEQVAGVSTLPGGIQPSYQPAQMQASARPPQPTQVLSPQSYVASENKAFQAHPDLAAIKPTRAQSVRLSAGAPSAKIRSPTQYLEDPPKSVPVPMPRQQSVPDKSPETALIGKRIFRRATSAEPPLMTATEEGDEEEELDERIL
mmetsp:Transcript_271/g.660  ORF Transcript_271/g.660 Transcript_271/m.660 type:complete len:538 (+) Transcript_271:60-1673(+)|eukprot:CAMPEP_0171530402 /NCGR_PEP_ID=MMETSP0959-20130129/13059_1 /TAXON_ID=87120 /ORGANISM="Aurantiochytrium limacinum, Strain ATCCMYA-1381" /LENGTH=537 /DNA_ID=CAMNT_0012073193 /DNA_START=44 /DNA_END=1657 /DNA_ORIENTATION=+